MLKNETTLFYFIYIYIYIYICLYMCVYVHIEREKRAYIIKSSANLSQQINQIMAQNPLLPNAVESLPASLNVHHFPVAHLNLQHNKQKLLNYRSPHTPHSKNQTKCSHPARTDNPPPISPPRAVSNLSSHLRTSIGS